MVLIKERHLKGFLFQRVPQHPDPLVGIRNRLIAYGPRPGIAFSNCPHENLIANGEWATINFKPWLCMLTHNKGLCTLQCNGKGISDSKHCFFLFALLSREYILVLLLLSLSLVLSCAVKSPDSEKDEDDTKWHWQSCLTWFSNRKIQLFKK